MLKFFKVMSKMLSGKLSCMRIGLVCLTCDDTGLTFPTNVIMGVNFIAFWQLALLYETCRLYRMARHLIPVSLPWVLLLTLKAPKCRRQNSGLQIKKKKCFDQAL